MPPPPDKIVALKLREEPRLAQAWHVRREHCGAVVGTLIKLLGKFPNELAWVMFVTGSRAICGTVAAGDTKAYIGTGEMAQ